MNNDLHDTAQIVRHLVRIVARNGSAERKVLASEIAAILCDELGLDRETVRDLATQQDINWVVN